MAEITLNTRIKTRYDTLTNWSRTDVADQYANLVLLAGEVAICYIPSTSTTDANGNPITTSPTTLTKVGDGTSTFAALPWSSGLAADVYPWAKASTKPTYTASEIEGLDTSGVSSGIAVELDFSQGETIEDAASGLPISYTLLTLTEEQYTTLTTSENNYIQTTISVSMTDITSGTDATVDISPTVICRRTGTTAADNAMFPNGIIYTADITAYSSMLNAYAELMEAGNYGTVDESWPVYSIIVMAGENTDTNTMEYYAALVEPYTSSNDTSTSYSLDFTSAELQTETHNNITLSYREITSTDTTYEVLSTSLTANILVTVPMVITTTASTEITYSHTFVLKRSVTKAYTDSASAVYTGSSGLLGYIYPTGAGMTGATITVGVAREYSLNISKSTSNDTTTYTFKLYSAPATEIDTDSLASTYVPQTRTINSKELSADITLSASDVGAYSTTEVDSAISAIPQYTLEINPELTGSESYLTGIGINGDNYKVLSTDDISGLSGTNSYPTSFLWTNGTIEGPTGTLSGSDMTDVTFGAIPSASGTQSGIITTDAQTIAGLKTFNNGATFIGTAAAAGLKTRGVSGLSSDGTTKDALWLNYDGNDNYSRKVYLGGFVSGAIAVRADKISGDGSGITTSYDTTGTVTITANYASDDDITALFA